MHPSSAPTAVAAILAGVLPVVRLAHFGVNEADGTLSAPSRLIGL